MGSRNHASVILVMTSRVAKRSRSDTALHHAYYFTREYDTEDEDLIPRPLRTRPQSRKPSSGEHDNPPFSEWISTKGLTKRPTEIVEEECNSQERRLGRNNVAQTTHNLCSLCNRHVTNRREHSNLGGLAPDASVGLGIGRVFCEPCFKWIYDLSICWNCGEVVARGQERISFGWCWWHWSCLGCLICKVSIYGVHHRLQV
jgi:hypothetical protein